MLLGSPLTETEGLVTVTPNPALNPVPIRGRLESEEKDEVTVDVVEEIEEGTDRFRCICS